MDWAIFTYVYNLTVWFNWRISSKFSFSIFTGCYISCNGPCARLNVIHHCYVFHIIPPISTLVDMSWHQYEKSFPLHSLNGTLLCWIIGSNWNIHRHLKSWPRQPPRPPAPTALTVQCQDHGRRLDRSDAARNFWRDCGWKASSSNISHQKINDDHSKTW